MKRSKLWLAAITGLALVTAAAYPASAHTGTTGTITDVDSTGANRTLPGNDFDPACVIPDPVPVVTGITGGTAPQYGCALSVNDGSSESTDLVSAKLESTAGTDGTSGTADDRLKMTIVVDGGVPSPGSARTDFDGPRDTPTPLWLGGTYMVMFNNLDQQVDRPTTNGGCTRVTDVIPDPLDLLPPARVYDAPRHWADGHRKFLAVASTWTGTDWSVTPQVGNYDPAATGGFSFTDLDTEAAMNGRWSMNISANTATAGDPDDHIITLEVEGIVRRTDTTNCVEGINKEVFANHTAGAFSPGGYTGDRIDHVFGFSTSDQVVVLPVTVPLSLTCDLTSGEICESDLDAIGGFVYYTDNTHKPSGGDVFTPGITSFIQLSVDNLGDTHTCPTPTFGGQLPRNPIEAQNQPCQLDDDALNWPLLAEFHRTSTGFTF